MSTVEPLTPEEYLALDAAAPETKRWEYHEGRAWSIFGARPEHIQLATDIATLLSSEIRGSGCRVRQSLQRVRAGAVNGSEQVPLGCEDYLYPDVVAFCYEGEYTDEWPPSLLNPQFVAEVVASETIERH